MKMRLFEICRAAAVVAATCALVATSVWLPAQAAAYPIPDISDAPQDSDPSPEVAMRQDTACIVGGVLPNSDLSQPPPAAIALRLDQAHRFSTGTNVVVAVIDTGVQPQPRLSGLRSGGDYIGDRDGLSDCDGHGTIVAGIIGGAASKNDSFVGVAPDAQILAIRQTSQYFKPELNAAATGDESAIRTEISVRSLARAIVHAANLGARVITVSVAICTKLSATNDQKILGGALKYAVDTKDALVIAAAGDVGEVSGGQSTGTGCMSNPDVDKSTPQDPRNWAGVQAVSSPAWFDDLVLSVGFVLPDGSPVKNSMAGPWVDVAAPGYGIVSLASDERGSTINGMPGKDGPMVPIFGSSFAAAFVAGTAALVRSRFPQLSAHQIAERIVTTAHPPVEGEPNNVVGHGVIDPVAALTYDVPGQGFQVRKEDDEALVVPPPPTLSHDMHPGVIAAIAGGSMLALVAVVRALTLLAGVGRKK